MNRKLNQINDDVSKLNLQDITRISMEIVTKINNKRNSKRSPSIWSPIAHLLNLRLSAIGSTIRANLKSNLHPLRDIISRLRRDEERIQLNELEKDWLEENLIQSDPFDWNE